MVKLKPSGQIRGIVTGIGQEEIYVKVVDRFQKIWVPEPIEYKNLDKEVMQLIPDCATGAVNIVTTARLPQIPLPTQANDWYEIELGL